MGSDNTAITEVLRFIDDGEWHEIYHIHTKYRLSPVRLIEAIDYLKNKGLLEVQDKRIRLLVTNDMTVLSSIRKIFLSDKIVIESKNEAFYGSPYFKVNEPYFPDMKLLDYSLVANNEDRPIHKSDKIA